MRLDDALRMYNIPYSIEEVRDSEDFTSYKLRASSASATRSKLKTRLDDLSDATDSQIDMISDGGLFLRIRKSPKKYEWKDYNGYVDFSDSRIPFIVGFVNGEIKMDNIDNARHMLVCGTTGSGKSVFLHNLIVSFLCNQSDYLYLVDCKRVEFGIYKDEAMVVNDVFGERSVASVTSHLIHAMEERYKQMEKDGVNDFSDFLQIHPNERRHILVVDELSDLISSKEAKKMVIPRLLRLAQLGRAAGFHVILATQRPDASVIDGTLKDNIPTRMAFRTPSAIGSRIILGQGGAERLLGNGDGLYQRNGSFNLERVQAPFISLEEIRSMKVS